MKIQDVNNLSSDEFIENFNNIFEKTSSIAISSEKKIKLIEEKLLKKNSNKLRYNTSDLEL